VTYLIEYIHKALRPKVSSRAVVVFLLMSSYFLDLFSLNDRVISPDFLCSMFTVVERTLVFVAITVNRTV